MCRRFMHPQAHVAFWIWLCATEALVSGGPCLLFLLETATGRVFLLASAQTAPVPPSIKTTTSPVCGHVLLVQKYTGPQLQRLHPTGTACAAGPEPCMSFNSEKNLSEAATACAACCALLSRAALRNAFKLSLAPRGFALRLSASPASDPGAVAPALVHRTGKQRLTSPLRDCPAAKGHGEAAVPS